MKWTLTLLHTGLGETEDVTVTAPSPGQATSAALDKVTDLHPVPPGDESLWEVINIRAWLRE